jgi:solute carrier family 35 protein F1/2
LKGDLLVIFGSMLYACSNVTEEYLVKKSNRIELMAMLGLFGAIISGIQISILERKELHSIKWNAGAVSLHPPDLHMTLFLSCSSHDGTSDTFI